MSMLLGPVLKRKYLGVRLVMKKWVNLRCFDGLLLLVWGCVFFLFWALIILLGEVGCSKFGHCSRCGGFPIHCWLDCFAKIVKYLIDLAQNLGMAPAAGASLFTVG